ncbi:hypothetical protein B0H16DRAFT_1532611 [Mycena metata]|uniref:Uncharacterized protein n=1 Tax=Mycena metata TaxID=1033252 RepID=A0AAD7N7D5_9AGAR|nr:hypothetical protein B0H16DRAFT_1553388 [Mycena metata]KAJ7760536.1 hypothetical protein B0H16DRAFT_1532611 [Mycena metata]
MWCRCHSGCLWACGAVGGLSAGVMALRIEWMSGELISTIFPLLNGLLRSGAGSLCPFFFLPCFKMATVIDTLESDVCIRAVGARLCTHHGALFLQLWGKW